MIIKKYKLNKEIINFKRYEDDLAARGWTLHVVDGNIYLRPIIWKKLISSWFSIFFLKKVNLISENNRLSVDMKANLPVILISLLIFIALVTRMIMRVNDVHPQELLLGFSVILIMSTSIFFLALRSELLKDIRKSIIVKL